MPVDKSRDKKVGSLSCGGCGRAVVVTIQPYSRGAWAVALNHPNGRDGTEARGAVIMNDVVRDPTAYLAAYMIGKLRRALYDLYMPVSCYQYWCNAEKAMDGLGAK